MKKTAFLILILSVAISAQNADSQLIPDTAKQHMYTMERTFFSLPYKQLENGIYRTSRAHAIYSYIIANLSTPGFDFFAVLPPQDQQELQQLLPENSWNKKIIAEYVFSKYSENSRKYTAMITMWGGKKQALTRVVTLGK